VERASSGRARRQAIRAALLQVLRPRCLEGARSCQPRAVQCGLAGAEGLSRWALGRGNKRGLGAVERRGLGGAFGRKGGVCQGALGQSDHGATKSQLSPRGGARHTRASFADSAASARTGVSPGWWRCGGRARGCVLGAGRGEARRSGEGPRAARASRRRAAPSRAPPTCRAASSRAAARLKKWSRPSNATAPNGRR
jgi:hypothetical protein